MTTTTTAGQLILIVEDNPLIAEFTANHLQAVGFQTALAESGEEALLMLRKLEPALIILDVVLGGIDGYEVCRQIRQGAGEGLSRVADVPVLMLTARAEEVDRIDGFTAGVDDYVVKPFNPDELCARVQAILRRAYGKSLLTITVGGMTIDLVQRIAMVDNERIDLTPKEFDLLHLLASHRGRVLPRAMLLERIWGYNYDGNTRTVDVHVQRLREKLASIPPLAEAITTERGVGYKLVM